MNTQATAQTQNHPAQRLTLHEGKTEKTPLCLNSYTYRTTITPILAFSRLVSKASLHITHPKPQETITCHIYPCLYIYSREVVSYKQSTHMVAIPATNSSPVTEAKPRLKDSNFPNRTYTILSHPLHPNRRKKYNQKQEIPHRSQKGKKKKRMDTKKRMHHVISSTMHGTL